MVITSIENEKIKNLVKLQKKKIHWQTISNNSLLVV